MRGRRYFIIAILLASQTINLCGCATANNSNPAPAISVANETAAEHGSTGTPEAGLEGYSVKYKEEMNEDELGDLGIDEDDDVDSSVGTSVDDSGNDPLLYEAAGIYVFASGSGAWETRFTMDQDGTFTGHYSAQDIYPGTMQNGDSYEATFYERHFSGRFSIGEQLSDSSWKLIPEEYSFEGTDGEEWVENDEGAIRYVNSPAPGLEDWSQFVLYGPSMPEDKMPYADWNLFGIPKDYAIGFGDENEMKDVFLRIGKE